MDTIVTSLNSYVLQANIARLGVNASATGNFTGTGNALGNYIQGGNGADILRGLGGVDYFLGVGGFDTYVLDADSVSDYGAEEGANGGQLDLSLATSSTTTVFGTVAIPSDAYLGAIGATGYGSTTTGGSLGTDIFIGVLNVSGSAFADTMTGGSGDETFRGRAGGDTLNGGANGVTGDTLSYDGSSALVTVNLATGSAAGGDATGDIISNFENLLGSGFADVLTGSSGANTLDGGGGGDTLNGGAGADQLFGGAGNDTIVFDALDTAINGGADVDTLRVIDGSLPTGFNLVANAFEFGEWLQTDTAGAAWSTVTSRYNTAWQLLQQDIVNDNATSSTTVYDPLNADTTFKIISTGRDAHGHITSVNTTFDDNTRRITYDDPDNVNTSYKTIRQDFNAAGQMTYWNTVEDNGASNTSLFDPAGTNTSYQSLRYDYNAAGQTTRIAFVFDNGTSRIDQLDPAHLDPSYDKISTEKNAAGQTTQIQTFYDDGSRNITYYDPAHNDSSFDSWRQNFNAAGQKTSEQVIQDSGRQISTYYDTTNQGWSTLRYEYDVHGHVENYTYNADSGARTVTYYYPDIVHPSYNAIVYNYSPANVLIEWHFI